MKMSYGLSISKVSRSPRLLIARPVLTFEGDDSVFVDLGLSSKEYPAVQTTW